MFPKHRELLCTGDSDQSALMNDDTSERLAKIEAHAAHLEHQVEQLNGVIIEQGKVMEALKKQLQRQATTLESVELERINSTSAKPPHYQ